MTGYVVFRGYFFVSFLKVFTDDGSRVLGRVEGEHTLLYSEQGALNKKRKVKPVCRSLHTASYI